LTIVTGAKAQRVIIENKRATGVEYKVGNKLEVATTRKDVILSAGPIGSPHLLQLSGIGDKDVLSKAGIELQHDLPGVGQNLQDH
ncbi:choline dehydrogenase, partial [Pseudoalteromonas sp. S3178]